MYGSEESYCPPTPVTDTGQIGSCEPSISVSLSIRIVVVELPPSLIVKLALLPSEGQSSSVVTFSIVISSLSYNSPFEKRSATVIICGSGRAPVPKIWTSDVDEIIISNLPLYSSVTPATITSSPKAKFKSVIPDPYNTRPAVASCMVYSDPEL